MAIVYKHYLFLFIAGAVFVLLAIAQPYTAGAQFASVGTGQGLSISSNPLSPGPHTVVDVSLDSYAINTAGAEIKWYVNGVEQIGSRNARSTKIITGDLGEQTVVGVEVIRTNGFRLSGTYTISPSVIDLIIESNSNVPVFYKGRALPTQGAPVRIVAIPHTALGSDPSDFTYTWELNQKVLFGGPIKGKAVADITMPEYAHGLLTVTVVDSHEQLVGKKLLDLTGVQPELHFYEENPLRGLSQKAIGDTLVLVGNEVSVRAEPYYAELQSPRDLQYEWRLDGTKVDTPDSDPSSITLRTTGGEGSSNVSFRLTDQTALSRVFGSFGVTFK